MLKRFFNSLFSTFCQITIPLWVFRKPASCLQARHMHSTVIGLIGGSLTAQAHCRRVEPLPSHPPFQHYSVSLSIPSLSLLTLIMAVGPGEWMTEVNAPRRKGAIVNEAEVKMSGWNRQIKEMKDEVDVWREHVKRDWHSSEKERELQVITSQLWSFFFLIFLALAFSPWPLIILTITDTCCTF